MPPTRIASLWQPVDESFHRALALKIHATSPVLSARKQGPDLKAFMLSFSSAPWTRSVPLGVTISALTPSSRHHDWTCDAEAAVREGEAEQLRCS